MKNTLRQNCKHLITNSVNVCPNADTGVIVAFLLLLAGCDASPHPTFFGATQSRTSVEGRTFTVFQEDNRAEVVRLGWACPQDRQGMRERMVRAAEQATGCRVNQDSFQGDDGEARMSLRCPK